MGYAAVDDRAAVATAEGVVVGPRPARARRASSSSTTRSRSASTRADDTLLAAYLIEPGRASYELADLGAEYGVEISPTPATDEETAALVRAAELPRRLVEPLLARLEERGVTQLYREVELPLTRVLADMERAGVKIDTYRMGEITARLAERVAELEARAYELAGEEFMIGSTQQVARILFEKLGLTSGRKGKTGYSTDAKVLRRDPRRARDRAGDRGVARALEAPQHLPRPAADADRRDDRPPAHDDQPDGRLDRPALDDEPEPPGDPDPHRARPRDPLGVHRRGGHKLLSADYSQIELRILAHVSGEPKLREAFARGEDIHRATAAEVLGKDPATLTTGERSIAKMINFGIVYGISAFGLSENLEIPREQAQAYIDAYLARFPHVQDFIARTIEQAARDGYVTSLLGRRRPVPEIRAGNRQTRSLGERLAVNFVMQGSNADIIKVAMIRIHRRLREEGRAARLVLQVHDELLLEVPGRRGERGQGARAGRDVRRLRRSTRRSRSTSASARTGPRRSPEAEQALAGRRRESAPLAGYTARRFGHQRMN